MQFKESFWRNAGFIKQDIICIQDNLFQHFNELYKVTRFVFPSLPEVVTSISPYIKYYEGLSYNREDLHRRHLRARRTATSQEYTLKLDFAAFHR